jgi:16S rRNA (uracil1498-N3)-methyltransferase
MPHLHRFYIDRACETADTLLLTGDEAHHALRVVRVRPGDSVALFDGSGRELLGVAGSASENELRIHVREVRFAGPPRHRVTIALGWLKRDKSAEYLVRHGTAIGVHRLLFFRADHSERRPLSDSKWKRLAIESAKQCGRLRLPIFDVAEDLEKALDQVDGRLLVATREIAPVPFREAVQGDAVALLVGPEGDWTRRELDVALSKGATPVSLGPATYRAEVAAFLAASLVLYELGGLAE